MPLPRTPPKGIPWDELRDEMSPQVLIITGIILRLLMRATRDEILAQVPRIIEEYSNYGVTFGRDELGTEPAPS